MRRSRDKHNNNSNNITPRLEIISRYKNNNGEAYKFDVASNGRITAFTLEQLLFLKDNIINATYIESIKDFRANPGCKIYTYSDPPKGNMIKRNNLAYLEKLQGNTQIAKNKTPIPIKKEEYTSAIREIYEESLGINYINICRKIRDKATKGLIRVDRSKHTSNSGYNTQLFELIETSGLTVEQFVAEYLSIIQPYQLQQFNEDRSRQLNSSPINHRKYVWLMDTDYRVSLVIKIEDLNSNNPLVVSFHETNKKGELNTNKNKKTFKNKKCIILLNKDNDYCRNGVVYFGIQRGFVDYRVQCHTVAVYKDTVVVEHKDIRDEVINKMYGTLVSIWKLYDDSVDEVDESLEATVKGMEVDEFEFASYGHNNVNYLLLMINIHPYVSDKKLKEKVFKIIVNNLVFNLRDEDKQKIYRALVNRTINTQAIIKNEIYKYALELLSK